jgi:hypothetical protein
VGGIQALTEPEGKGSTCIREPNSLAEFVPPPNFYDDEAIANARDEYEEYLGTSVNQRGRVITR